MIPLTAIPDGVLGQSQQRLIAALKDLGFSKLQEQYDHAAFGNSIVDLTTTTFTIRIVRERGIWEIEASVPGWKAWMPLSMWRWAFDGGQIPGAWSDFDDDAAWLLESLDKIEQALRTDEAHLRARLDECGRARLAELLRHAPTEDPDRP